MSNILRWGVRELANSITRSVVRRSSGALTKMWHEPACGRHVSCFHHARPVSSTDFKQLVCAAILATLLP
jgi:hypothetical protein